jgi:hypothetical protein
VFVQIAVMGDFVAALKNRLDRSWVAFHTPGGEKKGLVHAKLGVEINQARYGDFRPVP